MGYLLGERSTKTRRYKEGWASFLHQVEWYCNYLAKLNIQPVSSTAKLGVKNSSATHH